MENLNAAPAVKIRRVGRAPDPPIQRRKTPMGTMSQLTASDGHKLSAYRAEPAGKPKGGLIVAMEIFGVNSHIRAVADGYATDGYLVIAPALSTEHNPATGRAIPKRRSSAESASSRSSPSMTR